MSAAAAAATAAASTTPAAAPGAAAAGDNAEADAGAAAGAAGAAGAGGEEGGEGTAGASADGAGAAASGKGKQPVSEVVRLAREKRALERKVAELTERVAAAGKPKTDETPATREAFLADLKKRYEEDPDAFLEEVTGEDFVTLAGRLAKREETAKAPATRIEQLEKQLTDLQKLLDGERSTKAAADAKAIATQHVATVQKAIETAVNDDGEPLYPVLVTLDPDVLDEPVAVTAYKAVEHAFAKECREGGKPDGKIIKPWTEAQQEARFHAAFSALDAHYGKLRTPKTPSTPSTDEPEPSPTISKTISSGHVDPPVRRASGALSVKEALRLALKEHGLDQ